MCLHERRHLMKKQLLALALVSLTGLSMAQAKYKTYIGGDMGISDLNTDVAGEEGKEGFDLGVRATFAFKTGNWMFNPAVGFTFERIEGEDSGAAIQTLAPFAEFDFQYKLSNAWALGPVLRYDFAADNRRAEGPDGENSELWSVGGRVSYALADDLTIMATYLKDIKHMAVGVGDERDLHRYMLSLSIPLSRDKKEPVKEVIKETIVKEPVYIEAPAPAPVVVEVEGPKECRNSRTLNLWFASGKTTISASDKAKLMKVSKFASKVELEKVELRSHTDAVGSRETNERLSEARAEAVKAVLLDGGIDEDIIEVESLASTAPTDSSGPKNNGRNRRVELNVCFQEESDMERAPGMQSSK